MFLKIELYIIIHDLTYLAYTYLLFFFIKLNRKQFIKKKKPYTTYNRNMRNPKFKSKLKK